MFPLFVTGVACFNCVCLCIGQWAQLTRLGHESAAEGDHVARDLLDRDRHVGLLLPAARPAVLAALLTAQTAHLQQTRALYSEV